MTVTAPASRNAPCPCGSGRRYKECHGAIPAQAQPAASPGHALDPLVEVVKALADGRVADAERVADDVLLRVPGHPVALEVRARVATERGQPLQAVALLLDAVRGLAQHAVAPQQAYAVWTALNSAFLDAVAGQDAGVAEQRRAAYRTWQAARAPVEPPAARDVAVVLVLTASTLPAAAERSLESLIAQIQRPAELVAVCVGASPAAAFVQARLQLVPFEGRLVRGRWASVAEALDAVVAELRASWVVVLDAPHALAPRHLAAMTEALVRRGARWGFADGALEAFGEVPAATLAERIATHDAAATSIAKAESLGFAFIDQAFVATGSGAVMFARELAARVGGFRPLPGHEMWDFCLRALWEDEPIHVAERTYRHAVSPGGAGPSQVERESAQLAMFRDYYARACEADAVPPNPFAPALGRWGLAFVRRIFGAGHVLMVHPDTLERLRGHVARVVESAQPPVLSTGINLLGFAFGEFGLGESLRALARACAAGGIPFVVNDIEQQLATRQADRSVSEHLAADIRHRLSLMCVNPDMLKPVRPLLERTRAAGGRCVGYWYWELETAPRNWEPAYEAVDEIWCASEFVAGAVRRATDKPVVKITPPIEVTLAVRHGRAHFGVPEGRCLFLFTFDYNSFVKRKNPEAVIAAFRTAFAAGRDDVGLVVKSVNGHRRPDRVEAIRAVIGGDPRILHLDRFLSRDESYALIDATDVYVSLHRSEGLGLGLAEAMALGKPTVATGYSGNLEFMHEGNSLLVGYRLVPVLPGDYLVDDDRFVWAEPDVEAAARHLHALAGDASLRTRLGRAGREHVREHFGREQVARRIRERLADLDGVGRPAAGARAAVAASATQVGRFVSYAQNGEDALLAHVLEGVDDGFYVDVGAHDPALHSVTRAFYERGWRGVNVEPVSEWQERLRLARPRDVNLAVAADRERGALALHVFAGTGLSTLDAGVAGRHEHSGRRGTTCTVPTLPLAEIFAAHAPAQVHFLKIDVEGAEDRVLAGADFARHRPWIVVVEATLPMTGIPSHATWEPGLVAAGYRFAHDDGLNRFYVAEEHAALAVRFAARDAEREVVRAAEVEASADDLPAERRFDPVQSGFLDVAAPEPTLAQPVSQLCTLAQFHEPAYLALCRALHEPPALRREQWAFVWILRCLEQAGLLAAGRRGLGFSCNRDPLAAVMASRGCRIVATDLAEEVPANGDETGARFGALDDLNERGCCPPDVFREQVAFRYVDMNAIPGDLTGFDFVWSAGGLAHLGSLDRGVAFVMQAMQCLRPGGLAVHTLPFNVSSNGPTIESDALAVFRRQDLERLVEALRREGHRVRPLNLQPGTAPADRYVDVPPYQVEPHLKVRLSRFVVTSLGLAIERAR